MNFIVWNKRSTSLSYHMFECRLCFIVAIYLDLANMLLGKVRCSYKFNHFFSIKTHVSTESKSFTGFNKKAWNH